MQKAFKRYFTFSRKLNQNSIYIIFSDLFPFVRNLSKLRKTLDASLPFNTIGAEKRP